MTRQRVYIPGFTDPAPWLDEEERDIGVSVSVSFLRSPSDPEYAKKMAAVVALKEAGISEMPKELAEYFGVTYTDFDEDYEVLRVCGVTLDHDTKAPKEVAAAVRFESADYGSWIYVDVDKLPSKVKVLKFSIGC